MECALEEKCYFLVCEERNIEPEVDKNSSELIRSLLVSLSDSVELNVDGYVRVILFINGMERIDMIPLIGSYSFDETVVKDSVKFETL